MPRCHAGEGTIQDDWRARPARIERTTTCQPTIRTASFATPRSPEARQSSVGPASPSARSWPVSPKARLHAQILADFPTLTEDGYPSSDRVCCRLRSRGPAGRRGPRQAVKLKLDENLPERLVASLTDLGHDVDTVAHEGLAGRDDPAIWNAVQTCGAISDHSGSRFLGHSPVCARTHGGSFWCACNIPSGGACLNPRVNRGTSWFRRRHHTEATGVDGACNSGRASTQNSQRELA